MDMPTLDHKAAKRIAAKLSEWGHKDPAPLTVTIGRSTYIGAYYTDKQTGDRCLYLLGERPPSSHRRTVYRFPNDEGDWYLAGYIDQPRINSENRQYHPFGPWFQIRRWPHEKLGHRIDHTERYDLKPRKRMNITLGEIDA